MNQHDEQHGDEQHGDEQAYPPVEGAHDAAVPSSVQDGSPEVPAQSTAEAAVVGSPEGGEQPATTIPPTGDDRVDEALARLVELDRLDVTEHAGVVEDVHRALQDTLAEEEG